MRCEVIAIGTELLLGIIVDSNSAWIGEQLALNGIDSYFQVKVGDNFARIEACIRQGLERSDAVICCGGLGPTQDDISRDVIAHVMGVGMQRDAAIADKIRRIF
ncbi:MAG: competence/damage-inducible protein A, partial [Hyphomicrobiaceae bacterium]